MLVQNALRQATPYRLEVCGELMLNSSTKVYNHLYARLRDNNESILELTWFNGKARADDNQSDEPESLIAGAIAPKANFEVGVNEIAIEKQKEREEAVVEEFRKEEAQEAQEDAEITITEE